MSKRAIIVIILLSSLSVVLYIFWYRNAQNIFRMASYEECLQKENPSLCQKPDGNSPTPDTGNEAQYKDEIIVETPRPNQNIPYIPLEIKGKARGSWFFEGQMSAELFDDKGISLGKTQLQANSNWMTEDFVPFSGKLEYKGSNNIKKLIIRSANPSGLPENQKELTIPVHNYGIE